MTLPLTTTTIDAFRPEGLGDTYEDQGHSSVVATGVGAVIASPSGFELQGNGQQESIDSKLICNTVEALRHTDYVRDNGTGAYYSVSWVAQRKGLGLDHTVAGLRSIKGSSS